MQVKSYKIFHWYWNCHKKYFCFLRVSIGYSFLIYFFPCQIITATQIRYCPHWDQSTYKQSKSYYYHHQKKNSIWGVTRPSPKVSFISSKLYSYFISSIFFLFNTLSFTQSSCMISLAFVDKTSINRSPSSIFGGSFGESHLMHCLYFQLLSLVFLWQFY